ncbi:MAG: CBS domain-containing protein [Candidatus Woesearchaeota archaeon]|jgi:CBS domain-containing protein
MKTGYKISDIMTASPIKIDYDATVKECAELMTKKEVGSLLIFKNTKFIGIMTEEDIITKVVKNDLLPSKIRVINIMTPLKDIISIEPNKDIYDALTLMKENNIRRLPVMIKDKLQGLITFKDIMRIQPDLFDMIVDSFELKEEKRKLQFLD